MKITLLNTYSDSEHRLEEIENELQTLDETLKTPARTVDVLIRHIELLKERGAILNKHIEY